MLGREYPAHTFEVEKGRIAMFARAIGETDPVYFDAEAARAAGYRAIPVPPTFAFTIGLEGGSPARVIADMGIDKTRTVHGEQRFDYHGPIFAGDVITSRQKLVEDYEKKGGALRFLVVETHMTNQDGEAVCDLRTVIVVRNG
ncbi:MAG: MaoC family dehydratase N-terminal domain-containing protein [Hyphomicrobiales bacterium]|nr:MaoC family dehydratase N-terminal domain-containing protein [Hyphomicrobiales bacterium]MCP5374430.1 MaoC family dehydratase N-terminal domain-containing protein [Hyphomicrobiales bacterium]